ncbi:MAG: efflux transporter periplasmic adaptor subunit [Sphingomonadales bacterium]|nr:efflux transporter periplasmic adaptor subunit [Sphingomonadales bacterium]
MTEILDDQEKHTPLDALLDAVPRGVMRHWLTLLLLAIAALGALTFFIRFVTGDNTPYYSAPVERGDLVPRVSERGLVRGSGEVAVTAAVGGRVTWITGKSDGDVAKGEILAVLEAGQVASAVAIGRSRVAAARASLEAAQVTAQDAASRLDRFESVWKRSNGRAPALDELEGARVGVRRAALGVEVAQAEVRAAKVQLKDQQTRLASAAVRAPIAGTLVMRQIQLGQTVAENQPLFTIAAGIAPLTIEVPLTAGPGAPIRRGAQAQLRFDALPDVPQSARLTLLRAIPLRTVFTLENPDPRIRPGMAATVEVDLPERRNVLLVPDAALAFEPVDRQEGRQGPRRERIYVLEHGDPRRVYVTVGGSDGKRSEVFANDLEPGDQVIIGWRDVRSGTARSRR